MMENVNSVEILQEAVYSLMEAKACISSAKEKVMLFNEKIRVDGNDERIRELFECGCVLGRICKDLEEIWEMFNPVNSLIYGPPPSFENNKLKDDVLE